MCRSPLSHTLLLGLALLLASLLVAVAFAPPTWAAAVPAPSAGPSFVPSGDQLGDPLGMLLAGALVGAASLAVAVLVLAVGGRRSTAAAPSAGRRMTPEGPVDHGESGFTVLPQAGRGQERTHKRAA